jgi:hypothetical protein
LASELDGAKGPASHFANFISGKKAQDRNLGWLLTDLCHVSEGNSLEKVKKKQSYTDETAHRRTEHKNFTRVQTKHVRCGKTLLVYQYDIFLRKEEIRSLENQ